MFFYFSVMETTYADSWSDMAQPCNMDLWVMKWRSAWPIFHGPVILSYLEVYQIYVHHTLGVWISMTQHLTSKLMEITDLYSMVQWFYLISWRLFDVWTLLFGIMSQYDPKFDLKINIGHYDLYFMVQWFCLISWRLFYVWTLLVWPKVLPQNKI